MNIPLSYLPLIVGVLAATLTFLFGKRTKKVDRFYQYSQENLKEIYSPMFIQIREIMSLHISSEDREKLLDDFFGAYVSVDAENYKLGNVSLLEKLYDLDDLYKNFKRVRSNQTWTEFWKGFRYDFYDEINDGYWNLINSIYHEQRWQQFVEDKPYWLKSYYEFTRFLLDTSKALIAICALLVYFSGCAALVDYKYYQKGMFTLSILFLTFSIMLAGLFMLFNLQYIELSSRSKKQSVSKKLFKKFLPKLASYWKEFRNRKSKIESIDIPEMYENKPF